MLIVLHFCGKDEALAIKHLKLSKFLCGRSPQPIMLTYDRATKHEEVAKAAQDAFEEVLHFTYDPYPGPKGWPQCANWGWQNTARHISKEFREPWLWWEPDAVPLNSEWLENIENEYRKGGKPFMGHIVDGMGHMNGVGVYPHNTSIFTINAFLCRDAAWDYVMSKDMLHQCHKANHLFQHCWNVDARGMPVNANKDKDGKKLSPASFPALKNTGLVDFKASLFHRCKDETLADMVFKLNSIAARL